MITAGAHIAKGFVGRWKPADRGGRQVWAALWVALCLAGLPGCSQQKKEGRQSWVCRFPAGTVVAVAPALNFSGSRELDPVKVADLMASELSTLPGVNVIGVNRVLAILADQGLTEIHSPEHALEVADRLGADLIVVFAITEYEPYTPVVGMAAQLYGPAQPAGGMDPVAVSRMARPFAVEPAGQPGHPIAQVQRTFNATHEKVQHGVREYADDRDGDDSPYGWRKFIASQEWYLRFCCHSIARALMRQQGYEYAAAFEAASGD